MEGNCNRLCERLFYLCRSWVSVVLTLQSFFHWSVFENSSDKPNDEADPSSEQGSRALDLQKPCFSLQSIPVNRATSAILPLPVPAQNPYVGMLMLYFGNS